jgi:hypothetical protein
MKMKGRADFFPFLFSCFHVFLLKEFQTSDMSSKHSPNKRPKTLGDIKGWLADDDPFFKNLEMIREESRKQKPSNPFLPRKDFK